MEIEVRENMNQLRNLISSLKGCGNSLNLLIVTSPRFPRCYLATDALRERMDLAWDLEGYIREKRQLR